MIELAQLQDGQLVYGLYEEIVADKEDTCDEHYFDHVDLSLFKRILNMLVNHQ